MKFPIQIVIALTLISLAQSQTTTTRRKFEVATIKRNNSGRNPIQTNPLSWSPGRFTAINVTLMDVIVRVYPTRRIQIQGGPDWIDIDRFDIVAKADEADGEMSLQDRNSMVQALLEDRFKLRYHVELKDVAALAIIVDQSGPKFSESTASTTSLSPGERGKMIFQRMNIGSLANTLSNILQVPVIDATDLRGFYDFTLDPLRFTVTPAESSALDRGSAVMAAVREQLGLRFEKRQTKLNMATIDHAEHPIEP